MSPSQIPCNFRTPEPIRFASTSCRNGIATPVYGCQILKQCVVTCEDRTTLRYSDLAPSCENCKRRFFNPD
jgi:hypothetical protein